MLILNLALLNTLQSREELDANWAGFVGAVAVGEFLALGLKRDGFDGDESCCGASGEDFVEVAELGVGYLSVLAILFGELVSWHTSRDSVSQPKDSPILRMLSAVTLLMTFLLFEAMSLTLSPSLLTPMKADVENSSITVLVLLSRCSVMP